MTSSRFLLARRFVQVGVLALLWAGARTGFDVLVGDLSSSRLFGALPLSDPFAVAQVLATGHLPATTALVGAAVVLGVWLLAGGRAWCAWACPVNLVADAAAWTARRLHVKGRVDLGTRPRGWAVAAVFGLSALVGVPVFEAVSPIGLLHRSLLFDLGAGLLVVPAIFLLDAFVLRRGWCGSLCPVGAFWSAVGTLSPHRVRFDAARCDRCGDCVVVCPEPQVLDFRTVERAGAIDAGACTRCLRCVEVCRPHALRPGARLPTLAPTPLEDPHATP